MRNVKCSIIRVVCIRLLRSSSTSLKYTCQDETLLHNPKQVAKYIDCMDANKRKSRLHFKGQAFDISWPVGSNISSTESGANVRI